MKTKYLIFLAACIGFIGLPACDDSDDNGAVVAVDVVAVESITYQGAVVTGKVVGDATLATSYGFCYGEAVDPTVDGSSVEFKANEEFKATLALGSNKKYYLRSFVKTNNGIVYSANRFFTTPKLNVVLLEEKFDVALPATWTALDKDGDGQNWDYISSFGGCVRSKSWDNGALTPENYLASPKITIPANASKCEVSMDIAGRDAGYYQEAYQVVVSLEPITLDNCRAAEVVKPYFTLTDKYAGATFVKEVADISKFKGQSVYFAIVHGNCSDNDALLLKNVVVRAFE